MTTLDSLTAALAHLFVRIDAARPTDPVLRAAADVWSEKRGAKVMPHRADMSELPAFILPHAFYAQLAINGDQRWLVSSAGSAARLSLALEGHDPQEAPDRRMAVRLRTLFDLVSRRGEPYAVMFEVPSGAGDRVLAEIYAAPLSTPEVTERQIFAVINQRGEG